MTMRLCSTGGVLFAVAGGYPFALNTAGHMDARFVVPRNATSIGVDLYADLSALVHLTLYAAPSTADGDDGAVIVDRDSTGAVSKTYQTDATVLTSAQTITLTLPTGRAPTVYVARLWIESITGGSPDTVDHDADASLADEAPRPPSLHVTKVYFA